MSALTWLLYVFAGTSLMGILLHVMALGLYELESRQAIRGGRRNFDMSEWAHTASIVVLVAASVAGCVLLLASAAHLAGG